MQKIVSIPLLKIMVSASNGVIRFIVVPYILVYMYIRLKRLHSHNKHITKVETHTAPLDAETMIFNRGIDTIFCIIHHCSYLNDLSSKHKHVEVHNPPLLLPQSSVI
jgi:hypothetical protein